MGDSGASGSAAARADAHRATRAQEKRARDQVIEEYRRTVVAHLIDPQRRFFENLDPVLLDFATRAENDRISADFFDAARAARQNRPKIEQRFRENVDQGLASFGSPRAEEPAEAGKADTFSLIGQSEMDELVASENMIVKTTARFASLLYALRQRLTLFNGDKVADEDVPGGPAHLVRAFAHALDDTPIDFRAKLVYFSLFDKFVLQGLEPLYRELNEVLRKAGLLPKFRSVSGDHDGDAQVAETSGWGEPLSAEPEEAIDSQYDAWEEPFPGDGQAPQRAIGGGGYSTYADEDDDPVELGSIVMGSILELLAANRRMRGGGSNQSPFFGLHASRRELMSTIDRVQSRTTPDESALPAVEVDMDFLNRVKDSVSLERDQILSEVGEEQIAPSDLDLIDLIGLLFRYMFDDPVLPNLVKALLGHLHTPYLKIALNDRRLIEDVDHPARRLLDQLVEAGSRYVDEHDPNRGLFPTLRKVVTRVLFEHDRYGDDVSPLFEELFAYLVEKIDEHKHRVQVAEKLSLEAARGQEKMQLAKRRAQAQIQELLNKHPVPDMVEMFLTRTWNQLLVFLQLREGSIVESAFWNQAVTTASDLIALFDPDHSEQSRDKTARLVPELKERIRENMELLGTYSSGPLDALFAYLDDPEGWDAVVPRTTLGGSAPADSFDSSSGSDRILQPLAQTVSLDPGAAPADAADPAPVGDPLEQLEDTIIRTVCATVPGGGDLDDAPTVINPPHAGSLGESGALDVTDEELDVMGHLRQLEFGTWFEFDVDDTLPRRLKLAWFSPLTSVCMFVNTVGVRAENKSLHQLAQDVVSGRARIIEYSERPFIDRAFDAMRRMLQRGTTPTKTKVAD